MLLLNKMLEIRLIQFGIPRSELSTMGRDEISILLIIMEYLTREAKSNQQGEVEA